MKTKDHIYWERPYLNGDEYVKEFEINGVEKMRSRIHDKDVAKRSRNRKKPRPIKPFETGWEIVKMKNPATGQGIYRNKYSRNEEEFYRPPTKRAPVTDEMQKRLDAKNRMWRDHGYCVVYDDDDRKENCLSWITSDTDPISEVEFVENIDRRQKLRMEAVGESFFIDTNGNGNTIVTNPLTVDVEVKTQAQAQAQAQPHATDVSISQDDASHNVLPNIASEQSSVHFSETCDESNNMVSSLTSPTTDFERRYNVSGVASSENFEEIEPIDISNRFDPNIPNYDMMIDDHSVSMQEDMPDVESVLPRYSENVAVVKGFSNAQGAGMMNYAEFSQPISDRTMGSIDNERSDDKADDNDSICTQEDMPDVASVLPRHALCDNPLGDYNSMQGALEDIDHDLRGADDEWVGFLGNGQDYFDEASNDVFITKHDWLRKGWNNGQRAICRDWDLGKGCFNKSCSECHPCYQVSESDGTEDIRYDGRFNAVKAFYLKNGVKDINKYITLRCERDHANWCTVSISCPIYNVCFYPFLSRSDLASLGQKAMMDETKNGAVFWFRHYHEALCGVATVFLAHVKHMNCRPIHEVAPESSEVKIMRRKVNTESSQSHEVEFAWISALYYHEKDIETKKTVGSICYCNLALLENKGVNMRKACANLAAKKKNHKDRLSQARRHVYIPKGELRELLITDRSDPDKRLLYSPGTSKFKLGLFCYEEHPFNDHGVLYRCAYFDLKQSKMWFYSMGGPFNMTEFNERRECWYDSREKARLAVENVMITLYKKEKQKVVTTEVNEHESLDITGQIWK